MAEYPREKTLYCVRWITPSGKVHNRLYLRPGAAQRCAERQQSYSTAPVRVIPARIIWRSPKVPEVAL